MAIWKTLMRLLSTGAPAAPADPFEYDCATRRRSSRQAEEPLWAKRRQGRFALDLTSASVTK
jgi:hypothetical protein